VVGGYGRVESAAAVLVCRFGNHTVTVLPGILG
jgi:hypothetical protein